jgi:hypothetical protein
VVLPGGFTKKVFW